MNNLELSKFNDQERLETLQKYREIQKLKPYLSIKQIASMMPKDEGKLLRKQKRLKRQCVLFKIKNKNQKKYDQAEK